MIQLKRRQKTARDCRLGWIDWTVCVVVDLTRWVLPTLAVDIPRKDDGLPRTATGDGVQGDIATNVEF
jgi:hypothetical protein